MSFRKKGLSFLRNIYSSTNEIPSYYTEQKRGEYKGKWKYTYVLRKIAGFPFAVGYAFLLLGIISNFIVPEAHFKYDTNEEKDVAKNVCALFSTPFNKTNKKSAVMKNVMFNIDTSNNQQHTQKNNTTSYPPTWDGNNTQYSTKGDGKESRILFNNVPSGIYYGTYIAMTFVGIFSFFSRNTRSTMFLILPGLATKHSRNFIFTIVLGIVSNGPWNNTQHNINKLFKNGACMYGAALALSCTKEKQLKEVLHDALKIHQDLVSLRKKLDDMLCRKPPCRSQPYPPFKYGNTTWETVTSMAASSTKTIKLQVSFVLNKINSFGSYVEIARKCLTIVSIIWLIFDAAHYLRSYYTDSSYDNMYIEGSIPKYWKEKRYRKVIPLRHWEIKEGYSASNRPSIKRKSKLRQKTFVTFIFLLFVLVVLLIDYVIAIALQYIRDSEKFNISFKGVGQNETENGDFKVRSYNTKSCLSSPGYTSREDYWKISVLLLTAVLSCVFEVYASRLRARMCNLFYPDKAEERADYLFYRIYSGRIIRRYKMLTIVRREIERRIKLARFSPLKKLTKYLSRVCGRQKRHIICPGCGLKVKSLNAKEVFFEVLNKHYEPDLVNGEENIYEMASTEHTLRSSKGTEVYSEKREKEISALVCEECERDLAIGKNKIDDDLLDIYESRETLSEKSPPKQRRVLGRLLCSNNTNSNMIMES